MHYVHSAQMVGLYKDRDGEESYFKSSIPPTVTVTTQQGADGFGDIGALKAEIAQLKDKIKQLNVSLDCINWV